MTWPSWNCPHCDFPPSFNPNDVQHHYCGNCNHFCDDVNRLAELSAILDDARYVLWFCPYDDDQQHRDALGKPSVEWTTDKAGMTPHCLICGEVGATR